MTASDVNHKIFKGIIITLCTGLFIVSVVPEYVSGSFFISYRNIYFNILAATLGIAVTSMVVFKKFNYSIRYNTLDLSLVLFFVYIILNSISRNIPITDNAISFAYLLLFYFVIKQLLSATDSQTKQFLLTIFLLSGFFEGLVGLLQLLGLTGSFNALFKVTGTFLNPAPFSIHIISYLAFSLAIYFYCETNRPIEYIIKYVAAANVFIFIMILPQTGSRTAWFAGFIGVLIVVYFKYGLNKIIPTWLKSTKHKIYALLALIGLGYASVLLYQYKPDSVHGRLFIWNISFDVIKESPVLGNGFNTAVQKYNWAQADYFSKSPTNYEEIRTADQVTFIFNDYLLLLIEQGFVGLLLFLLVILFSFVHATNHTNISSTPSSFDKALRVGSISSLTALLVTFFSSYPLEILSVAINIIFFLAAISALSGAEREPIKTERLKKIIEVPALLILVVASTFTFYQGIKKNAGYAQISDTNSKKNTLSVFSQHYESLKNNPVFCLEYGKMLSKEKKYIESIAILEETKRNVCDTALYLTLGNNYKAIVEYGKAEDSYRKAINIVPNRFVPRYYLTKFYLSTGDTVKALKEAEYIVTMPVKIDSHIVRKIKSEMKTLVQKLRK